MEKTTKELAELAREIQENAVPVSEKTNYHSAVTGKFVTKEYAEKNPDTTVELSNCNLRQEVIDFFIFLTKHNGSIDVGDFDCIEDAIYEYLESK